MICTYFPEYLQKCFFVFIDTGLEYEATKRHLIYLHEKYGITIEKIRGISVVTAIKRHGIPILNKSRSEDIYYYLRGAPLAIERIEQKEGRYGYNENMRAMIHYIKENGIQISSRCCKESKKKPIKNIFMNII